MLWLFSFQYEFDQTDLLLFGGTVISEMESFYTACSGEADIISEQEWNQKWQMQLSKNYGSSKPRFNVSHWNSDYVCLFSILPIADQRTLQRWKHHANVYAENCCDSNYHKPLVYGSVPFPLPLSPLSGITHVSTDTEHVPLRQQNPRNPTTMTTHNPA